MMKFLTKSALVFSLKTALAAFVAFYMALRLNLEKPAWSLTTVYVVSQLYTASTVSKSLFRLLGTVLGGVFIYCVYPATVESPIMFSLAVSGWVALCLYFSLHDRTPKSYIFMLAGYSAAIIGFPDVTSPSAISYTVISRIEEVAVGILVSSLVHSLIFPTSMRALLENSVTNWYQQASKVCASLLSQSSATDTPERDHILVQMANYPVTVEMLMTHCAYETTQVRRLVRMVSVQYQHLSYLVPTLTAIEKRLSLLAAENIPFPLGLSDSIRQFLGWLEDPQQHAKQQQLNRQLATALQQVEDGFHQQKMSSEESLLFAGLLERLQNFVRIISAYHNVELRISRLSRRRSASERRPPKHYFDNGMIALSSFTAFLATTFACLFWIGTGWKSGYNAAMMAAVTCSFFASHDSPSGGMKVFFKGLAIAISISIFYSMVLLPGAVTFEALMICLLPALILMGLIIANPATNFIGLIIATQLPAYIGLSHDFSPAPLATINAAFSTFVGVIISMVLTVIIRNKRPSKIARRALRAGVKELLQLTNDIRWQNASLLQRQQFVQRMLDRITIILPRNKADPALTLNVENNLITEVWLGANLFDFYGRHAVQLQEKGIDTERLFYEISHYLKRRLKNIHATPHSNLFVELERLLGIIEPLARGNSSLFKPLCYLFNVRLSLFPSVRWQSFTVMTNRSQGD